MNKQPFLPARPTSSLAFLAFAFWIVGFHASCLEAFAPNVVGATRQHSRHLPLSMATEEKQQETKKQVAPQYEKIMARLSKAESVAKGTVLLHIEAEGDDEWDYEPGHVLALEIQGDPKDKSTHTYEDTQKNNGWMRGPYTVSSSKSSKELQVLLKLVGEKSQAFADAPKGTPIKVGGKFKVPIVEGIDVDTTSQVVLLSTGVGVGPCVGAMEQVVQNKLACNEPFPPIHLVASFRTEDEIALADKLNQWQKEYPNQISWTPVTTNSSDDNDNGGRISSSVERLQECLTASNTIDSLLDLQSTHFHLIGNGGLVYEFQKGLEQAGIPNEKVTLEVYFGHQTKPKEETVDIIAKAIQGLSRSSSGGAKKEKEMSSASSQ
ncbi:unnamed protein product [Cylindrotheca closterium]|uniref:FAD-binding FR-type domain-containing protein n=1 Tax=Cylindrotheca closterium TaxID=2856 RepID=A0AAD2CU94_9STRA|nr:unnamed protein product [Cylindrotheca closterium]